MKLNRYIASIDMASRRGADKLIKEGKVLVNGNTEINPAYDLLESDKVSFTFDVSEYKKSYTVIKLYKPKGYVVSTNAKEGIPIYQLVKDLPAKIFPVGRLDKDSCGLIILTDDGVLHKKIIGSDSDIEKEYFVSVAEEIKFAALKKLEHGLFIDNVALKPAVVKKINNKSFFITLKEGRNRQIRKMCRKVGYNVMVLKRIRIGSILLDGLKEGKYKHLSKEEIDSLFN